MPVERIGGAEQDDLRCLGRDGEMHRRGIDRREQAGALDEGSQREEVHLSGKVNEGVPRVAFDACNMSLLERRIAAGQDGRKVVFGCP